MFRAQKVIVRLAVLSLIPYINWLVKQNDRIWIVKSVFPFLFPTYHSEDTSNMLSNKIKFKEL